MFIKINKILPINSSHNLKLLWLKNNKLMINLNNYKFPPIKINLLYIKIVVIKAIEICKIRQYNLFNLNNNLFKIIVSVVIDNFSSKNKYNLLNK